MSDFNKGDFTQQGIAGDVTSLVRLNEKRTVKLTLSADDASDNCDISGSVIDELNGKTYPIGSGVSGNIEITENGENINVAPYATATVNVSGGGGDFVYIVNEDVVIDENHTGTVSNVDTSEISHVDNVLCYIKNDVDDIFSIGLYTYVAEDDQSIDVKTYDGADFHVFTEDGITWQADVNPIASVTIKLVIIKMPDFYSAN